MQRIGYARVSSADQDTAAQIAALHAAGCTIVRQETGSGTTTKGRTELQSVLQFLRPGDCLVVTRIDRLARSIGDLVQIVATIEERGAALCCTEQPVDTSTAAGRCFLQMLGVFAEFETAIRRDRQMEGIARAKARGVYRGRKPSIDAEEVAELKRCGFGAASIARQLGIGRASVYRVLRSSPRK